MGGKRGSLGLLRSGGLAVYPETSKASDCDKKIGHIFFRRWGKGKGDLGLLKIRQFVWNGGEFAGRGGKSNPGNKKDEKGRKQKKPHPMGEKKKEKAR